MSKGFLLALYVGLALMISGCSLFQTQRPTVEIEKATKAKVERPKWISSPASACKETELCVVGEGSGRLSAESNARAGVSKFFETHIKVQNATTTNAQSSIEDEVVSGGQSSIVQSHVDEASAGLIEGVQIREVFEKEDGFYALAVLSKRTAISYYSEKIKNLDYLNATLFESFKRSAYFELRNNLLVRENLASRVKWMGGSVDASPVSLEDMQKKKQFLLAKPVVVLLEINDSNFSGKVRDLITVQLINSLYRVTTDRQNGFNYVLRASFVPRKEFLNVKGFEKYSFMLHIEAFNDKEQRKGVLHTEETVVSRGIDAAFLEALPKINKYLNDNFGTISID